MKDKAELLETFDRFRAALFANDVQMLDALMAEDYVGYDPLGNPQDKRMSIEAYRPGCVKLDKYDVEQLEVRLLGEVGIIAGKGYIHGVYAGSEFEHYLRFLDLYVNQGGKWRLSMSQVTPIGAGEL